MQTEHPERVRPSLERHLARRIQQLSEQEIDELWFRCGWVDANKDRDQRALRKAVARAIKHDTAIATSQLRNLLLETPHVEFVAQLQQFEHPLKPENSRHAPVSNGSGLL